MSPESQSSSRSLYEHSTQHQHWNLSHEELQEKRAQLNGGSVQTIRSTFEADDPGSSANIQFLTPEDELILVKLYMTKIGQLCAHFRMPEVVEATACTYLRRFYLRNTVMDWHPKNVMLTTIFLATKTTNNPIPLETYVSHIPKTTPSDVLDLEFLVAQSLGFEFVVWHAHRALWGIYLDAQTLQNIPFKTLHEAYIAAVGGVRISRLTDVELIYSPSQIALACLHAVAPEIAEQWATAKGEQDVISVLPGINAIIQDEGVVPDLETVREIDKRLKICKNPEKVVGSKAYLKKQAEEEVKGREKRERKAAEIRAAEAVRDPFSDDLAVGATPTLMERSLDDDDD
ncbi:cyclin-like protein [Cantharellus anzutake]|uniref:cyclin-like protein n=1 Tax=Cantharellus anzutake TaxID=1750568 RepID=UPI0019039DB4|nr:cyclin-like protein [Cantharellus anzutake]KAF8337514.1 cyclin-like protein [Cantharellus anzutake]